MVDYNNFAKTFSQSRKKMKWAEIEFFLSLIPNKTEPKKILDIWCGNGRLLGELIQYLEKMDYLWFDLSQWLLDEAMKIYPGYNFQQGSMTDLKEKVPEKKYDIIFFIASFHHLQTLEERINVMEQARDLLEDGGRIFFTNWALDSELNVSRYEKSRREGSENEFWGSDYDIKIWEFTRYYHCFRLKELEYIFEQAGFFILENRLFENGRNYITVLEKK